MKLTGAQAVWESLVREGVDTVFGISGGAVIHLYHALPDYPIHHILTRHEQGAAHAADGYARATGQVGVCIATSGPGATNLVTGLATAYMDSSPVVAITGQVVSPLIGTDAFQEVDITAITLPVTKHNYLVTDVNDLPMAIKEAFYIARTGRPGPVLIDIAKDVQAAEFDYEYPEEVCLPGYRLPKGDLSAGVEAAAQMIDEAQRPVVIAGHGVIVANAEHHLLAMAERGNIPVVTTLLGIGALPETHPLCLGMAGMHGEAYANLALSEADLIVALGCRFDDRLTGAVDQFLKQARVIHVDIDPVEIEKNLPVDLAIVGDLKEVLPALIPLVPKGQHGDWLAQIQEWRGDSAERDMFRRITAAKGVGPRAGLNLLSRWTPQEIDDAVAAGKAQAVLAIPGIGPKRAESIIRKLTEEQPAAPAGSPLIVDAEAALVSLGLTNREARERVARVVPSPEMNLQDLLRLVLSQRG